MALCKDGGPRTYRDPGVGAEVRVFANEKDMLLAWLEFFREYDPDAVIVFQVTIGNDNAILLALISDNLYTMLEPLHHLIPRFCYSQFRALLESYIQQLSVVLATASIF